MKKHTYLMTTLRDIHQGLGRFFAIVVIVFLGVLLFVGIKSIGPNLETTINSYIDTQKVSDLQVVTTAGFTKKDQQLVQQIKSAQVQLGYSWPYHERQHNQNLQIYSYKANSPQNKSTLIKGTFPKTKKEVVIDETLSKNHPLNSTLIINSQRLKQHSYRVVGYVQSPIYIDQKERGRTNLGDGNLSGYIYLPQKNFTDTAYSIMYIRFADLASMKIKPTSAQYQHLLHHKEHQLKTILQKRKRSRLQEIKNQIQRQLLQQQKQLDLLRQQRPNSSQLLTAQHQLQESNQQLITPNYFINERQDNPGFSSFTSLSHRIDTIGNIFPVFFFLIGILITFTTITRMVEENRQEIGILKAIGYRNYEIAQKYLLYAFLTVFIATLVGILAGTKLLPPIVYQILSSTYIFPSYPTHFWITPILEAIIAALIATLGATTYILIIDLQQKPVTLLLPPTPPTGKRTFLERMTKVWHQFSLNQKRIYRNLFRYKARMILTIVGVAGCTGLMVAGFGLRDSVGKVASTQFKQIEHYQVIVTLKPQTKLTLTSPIRDAMSTETHIKDQMPVYLQSIKVRHQPVTLYAVGQRQQLDKYFTLLKTGSQSRMQIPNQGALITQGLARNQKIKSGQIITFRNNNGQKVSLKIAGIVKNYLGNNIFVKQKYLNQQTHQKCHPNSFLLKTASLTSKQRKQVIQHLQASGQVMTTTFVQAQIKQQTAGNTNLQPIVLIFIVLSGILAFVVLFNLTNINISERQRELATMKVLGFYNREVTMTIAEENIIFTIVGIILGLGVGHILTQFIVTMASSSEVTFPLLIPLSGYLFAIIMTLIFLVIVLVMTHKKLQALSMITALKANE